MRLGGLFEGYGGLTMAAQAVLDCEPAWFVENDPGACAVLAEHHPEIPNLGDITQVDWHQVEPVEVLTAGFPCQDISAAGKRAGIGGERSGLWSYVVDACRVLRPRYLLAENVGGIVVRGLDTVLADLAALGFDAEWTCVPASAVGAPHRRERWFIATTDATHHGLTWGWRARAGRDGPADRGESVADADRGGCGGNAGNQRWRSLERATADRDSAAGLEWREYAPAVARWESILGRPAPSPTERGRRGSDVLSPRFVEWLMGLPEGWVTDVALSRNQQLKLLGNGVVPQQAAAAFDHLLPLLTEQDAA